MTKRVRVNSHPLSRRSLRISIVVLSITLAMTAAIFAVTTLWTRTVNGSADGPDFGVDVALAPGGDLYVVGYTSVTDQLENIWVRKYSPSGAKLWTRTKNGPASDRDGATGADVDTSGNLYVVGWITVPGQGSNIWIRKYDPTGTTLWTRVVDGPASGFDYGQDIAVRGTTSLYVVGMVDVPGQGGNIWIRKYSSSGSKIWTRTVDGPASEWDEALGVDVDDAGNVYVVGSVGTTLESRNIWIRKYNSAGTKIWTRSIDGPGGGWDKGSDVVVDPDQDIYFVGFVYSSAGGDDIWIRKYDSFGGKLWTRTVNGPANYPDEAAGAAVGANGALYVTGYRSTSPSEYSLWLSKFNPDGVKRWATTYSGPDVARGAKVVVNDSNRLYVTGGVTKAGQGYNILVRKYRQ